MGLSLVIGDSLDDRIKFIFLLFDLDRDEFLSKKEMENLLQTSIISFRNFTKGPNKTGETHQRDSWISKQKNELMENGHRDRVTYIEFKEWAEKNLNAQSLLNTDDTRLTAVAERQKIYDTLENAEKSMGASFYVVSNKWWQAFMKYHHSQARSIKTARPSDL